MPSATPPTERDLPPSALRQSALLFPGQGSQTAGMRELVQAHRPDLLELAQDAAGADPFESLSRGTRYLQPAIYCASLALWSAAGSPRAAALAGHSLGELAALAAAGVMSDDDGVRLAALRGRLMQEVAETGPEGGMVALLGDDETARELAKRHGFTVANDNAPGQLVLSGPAARIDELIDFAKAAGLKARRLPIAGAFHCAAMGPAAEPFREALDAVELRPPRAPVYSGVTARPFDDVRVRLTEALTAPVKWRQTVEALRDAGVRRFVEVGPGKVLRGLVRRIAPECDASLLVEPELARA